MGINLSPCQTEYCISKACVTAFPVYYVTVPQNMLFIMGSAYLQMLLFELKVKLFKGRTLHLGGY